MLRRSVIMAIRVYQLCLSPLFPGCCRFTPTCSEYAILAVQRHGLLKGSALSLGRLLRCHPLCRGGVDPVP
ncbi:MAG: membrane protein insertion efficiency factor YidD [Desulfovibrionaceae bacterium]